MESAINRNTGTIHSNIERISIKDYIKNHNDYFKQYFSEKDAEEMVQDKRMESCAGICALKRSLSILFETMIHTHIPIKPKEITITNSDSGTPVVVSIPEQIRKKIKPENLYVSISHTRRCAYGLSVYREVW